MSFDYFYILIAMAAVIFFASLVSWLITPHRTCGHDSDSYTYVGDERMWMCAECYNEYTYDRLGIGR